SSRYRSRCKCVTHVVQDKMRLDTSTAYCGVVPLAHAAYGSIRVFLRRKYIASFGHLRSSLQRGPNSLGHRDGPARGFGLSKWVEDGARGEVDVLNSNSKYFLWPQPCV